MAIMQNRCKDGFFVALAIAVALCSSAAVASAQTRQSATTKPQVPVLHKRTNLVLVPALVTTKSGNLVFSLTADDFLLTDNGIPRMLKLVPNSDLEPLALAVVVETGGGGRAHLRDYRDLGPVLATAIDGVPHRVAVIAFGGTPQLALDFTPDTAKAARTIAHLQTAGPGADILDALNLAIIILRRQPPGYRRAILLICETAGTNSQTTLESVMREVDNTGTEIYAVAFSSAKAAIANQVAYQHQPYGPGGCMGKGSHPDAHGKIARKALDCAGDLLPPIEWARLAFRAAHDKVSRNVPQTVARLTGGEYFVFKNQVTLTRDLLSISNDIPNYYVLTFRPHTPEPGFHSLKLSVRDKPGLRVTAPSTYWVEPASADKQR
jgi:VWFA-related protein